MPFCVYLTCRPNKNFIFLIILISNSLYIRSEKFLHRDQFSLGGKQGCKLASDQDAIVLKVLKARLYHEETFLDANLGHNPSFVWRSIHASKVVLKGVLKWKVMNGTKIMIIFVFLTSLMRTQYAET